MATTDNTMFQSPNEFSLFIERMVSENKNLSHVDAIIKYCSEHQIDEEDIKELVNKSLMAKLKHDFTEMNYFKKTTASLNF